MLVQNAKAKYMRNYYKTHPLYRAYIKQVCRLRRKKNPRKILKGNQVSAARTKLLVWSIKASNPCTDCKGYFHPTAMQFDHIFPKMIQIGYGMWSWSFERLLQEIRKCQLVCSNCHVVRTYTRKEDNCDRRMRRAA